MWIIRVQGAHSEIFEPGIWPAGVSSVSTWMRVISVMLPSLSVVMVLERDKWPVLWVDTRGRRRAGAWENAGGFANLLFVVTDTLRSVTCKFGFLQRLTRSPP